MKLFVRGLIILIFLIFCFNFFISSAFALTTPFRSANIITTDSLGTFYTNLNNCSIADGLTCDRSMASLYGNLYFRDFGNYYDFEMPVGSTITKVRIRVTGKSTASLYVGLSSGQTYSANCQSPSDLWTLWQLNGSAINTQTFVVDVIQNGGPQAVSSYCLSSYNFENKNFIFRVNYSSGSNWSANIDNFEIAFDYNPPVTPTPTPTATPTPTVTSTPTPTPTPSKTPLILIPGIGGSELKVNEMKVWDEDDGHAGKFNYLYLKDEVVWLNVGKAAALGKDDYFDVLRMKTDGITSEVNIGTTGNLLSHAYQGTIDFFTSNGYTLNQDLFLFPYDWRKDISGTKNFLDEAIQQIKTQTGSSKVDIIAHSMGGLVARNYIADASKALNVRKLFTLGTPHLGSVDSLKAIRYGNCLTIRELKDFPICIGLSPSEVKDVVKNMISSFELAPSQKYFDFYSGEDNQHLYPYRTEDGGLNYNQIKDLLTGFNHNTSLFTPAETFHNLDGLLSNTNDVDVILIAGSGKNTLGQIVEENNHKDMRYINGDGTVPLFSASLVDTSRSKSLLGNAKVFYTKQEHGELVASGSALALVKNILEENSELPDGVSTKAYSLPLVWWLFSKHSPVNMNIYDSLGNHTGLTTDGFETNIPGSSYDTLDDEAFIFISDNGTYNIKFEATDNGSFDFRVRKFENENVSQEILYNDVPLTTSTKAELSFNTSSSQSPIMYVDEDGNGTTDKEVNSYTSPNLTSTSTPTPTLTPIPTPTIFPTASSTSQKESVISEENNVLGAKTNSKTLRATEKNKNSPLTVFLIILAGGVAIAYIKFKR